MKYTKFQNYTIVASNNSFAEERPTTVLEITNNLRVKNYIFISQYKTPFCDVADAAKVAYSAFENILYSVVHICK